MALYDEFRFKPSAWLPHSELPLEELERVRNIKARIWSIPIKTATA